MLARLILLLAVFGAALATFPASAGEPILEMVHHGQTWHLSRSALLANPAARLIDIPMDVAYRQPMRFRALPLTALLPDLSEVDGIRFSAADGFSATIPARILRDGQGSQAWLAIEEASTPWPALKPGGISAGPFYLVWIEPEKMAISPEQWPYQVVRIADSQPLAARFPQILPQRWLAVDSPEWRGLQVFSVNCAACHQINGGGDATLGPDLNRPFSPVDYFQEPFLRRLIRAPASVRNWPQRQMPGFSTEVLPEAALDDLLAYFRHMAAQRGR